MDRFGHEYMRVNSDVSDEEYAEDLYWTLVAVRSYLQWKNDGFPTLDISDVLDEAD